MAFATNRRLLKKKSNAIDSFHSEKISNAWLVEISSELIGPRTASLMKDRANLFVNVESAARGPDGDNVLIIIESVREFTPTKPIV